VGLARAVGIHADKGAAMLRPPTHTLAQVPYSITTDAHGSAPLPDGQEAHLSSACMGSANAHLDMTCYQCMYLMSGETAYLGRR
jgi:hypothetical protein